MSHKFETQDLFYIRKTQSIRKIDRQMAVIQIKINWKKEKHDSRDLKFKSN